MLLNWSNNRVLFLFILSWIYSLWMDGNIYLCIHFCTCFLHLCIEVCTCLCIYFARFLQVYMHSFLLKFFALIYFCTYAFFFYTYCLGIYFALISCNYAFIAYIYAFIFASFLHLHIYFCTYAYMHLYIYVFIFCTFAFI